MRGTLHLLVTIYSDVLLQMQPLAKSSTTQPDGNRLWHALPYGADQNDTTWYTATRQALDRK